MGVQKLKLSMLKKNPQRKQNLIAQWQGNTIDVFKCNYQRFLSNIDVTSLQSSMSKLDETFQWHMKHVW